MPSFNQKELIQAFKRNDLENPFILEDQLGIAGERKKGIVIWMKNKDRSNENLTTLHHECIHAASYLLSSRGVKADFDNDEPLTYMSQFIFSKCVKHLK